MRLSVADARALSKRILASLGYDREDAALITEVLVEAHLWGRPDSGLGHLRSIAKAKGERRPVTVIREDSRSTLLDGGNNPGFLVSSRAMLITIAKAKETGLATAGASNAYLGGVNGYYVSLAARQGLIGMMATAATRRVAPAGGIDPLFGTNPIAFAVPSLGEPVVLDMATSTINYRGVSRAARLGRELAPGIAIGPDGEPTTDPQRALAGAILPFGGYKGSGLAMIVQCLGILAGGAVVPEGDGDLGYFFLAIDPSVFMPIEDYKARVSELVERVHAVRPAAGVDKVRVPGERSLGVRARLVDDSIEIDDPLYSELVKL